jgi:hypothetical protein
MQAQCQQTMKANLIFLFLIANLIAGCATSSNPVANMPAWMGGLPADAPPRPSTPAYEAWQAERAKEAARLKTQ